MFNNTLINNHTHVSQYIIVDTGIPTPSLITENLFKVSIVLLSLNSLITP